MNRINITIALGLVVAYAGKAEASEWPPYSAERAASPQYKACVARDPSNYGQGICLEQEYRRQQTELTIAFEESVEGVPEPEKKQRIKAQAAWKAFVDANCAVRAMNPGSGAGVFTWGCLVRETITRRTELNESWDY